MVTTALPCSKSDTNVDEALSGMAEGLRSWLPLYAVESLRAVQQARVFVCRTLVLLE